MTLPCQNAPDDQDKCDHIDWTFRASVRLTERGHISENAKTTDTCSLVIKQVRAEDAGRYTCRQSGRQGAQFYVSVVTCEYSQQNVFTAMTVMKSILTSRLSIFTSG